MTVRLFWSLILAFPLAAIPKGQAPTSAAPGDALVKRALATELRSAQDQQHPFRYRLRKSSPRLISTKEIYETSDGAVARLIAINDSPLGALDKQKEQARLNALFNDPARQLRRKQAEEDDSAHAMKILQALPKAFLYQYKGSGTGPTGTVEKFSFKPNPGFKASELETQALVPMTGEIWIDPVQERVTHLEGHLQNDVDFGWGILGRLYKGGWIVIEQADIGGRQWHIVRFQMAMSARVLFKTRTFDTTEDESHFAPVPANAGYRDAIKALRADEPAAPQNP